MKSRWTMLLKIKGFFPVEKDSNILSVKIPLFSDGYTNYVQNINEITNKIIDFVSISDIEYEPLEESTTKKKGDEALFIIKYNKTVTIGNKKNIDKLIIQFIENHRLTNINLYSLYVFLGIPKMVEQVVDELIKESDIEFGLPLSKQNFIIPTALEISSIEENSLVKILDNYSNYFINSSELNCSDMIYSDNHRNQEHWKSDENFKLGMYSFKSKYLTNRLHHIVDKLNRNESTNIIVNDFILNLLILSGNSIPKNCRIIRYISNELLLSPELNDNENIKDIKFLQVKSSTSYYSWKPEVKVGNESFVFMNQRIEKSSQDMPNSNIRFSDDEETEIAEIKNSILKEEQQ